MKRQGDKETRGQGEMRIKRGVFQSSLNLSLSPFLLVSLSPCLLVFLLTGCSRQPSEAEKRAAVDSYFAQARSCWPSDGRNSEDAGGLRLTVESVRNAEDATRVRLVAYALDEAVDFHLPVYRLSAGRWLINEKGRAYLLDERCREFKLNDRKPSAGSFAGGRQVPLDGIVRLNPGQAFEVTLVFPPMPDQTRVGALVYDGRVLPFTLNAETQRR